MKTIYWSRVLWQLCQLWYRLINNIRAQILCDRNAHVDRASWALYQYIDNTWLVYYKLTCCNTWVRSKYPSLHCLICMECFCYEICTRNGKCDDKTGWKYLRAVNWVQAWLWCLWMVQTSMAWNLGQVKGTLWLTDLSWVLRVQSEHYDCAVWFKACAKVCMLRRKRLIFAQGSALW